MNKINNKILFSIVILSVSVFLFGKIISDNTKTYIEKQPADFQSRAEDFIYEDWIEKYNELEANRLSSIEKSSAKYSKELSGKSGLSNPSASIKNWRDDFSNDEYKINSKVIIGEKINNNISYKQDDIKSGGISLTRIKSLIEKGSPSALFADSGKIYAAVDPDTKEFSSLLNPDDIAVLIRGIFQSRDYSIWLTIDPPASSVYQKIYGEVKYGGLIQNTHIGSVLFESDRIMKCLSVGFDNRTAEPLELGNWSKSEFDFLAQISVEQSVVQGQEWHRFWFTTEEAIVEIDHKEKTVRLKGPVLVVKTERMQMVNGKLQSSFKPVKNTSSQMWTDHFNANFQKYAEIYPVLKELEAVARWSVLLMALRETGVVITDLDMPEINYLKTSVRTPVITVVKEREVLEETSNGKIKKIGQAIITGGVGFQKMQLISSGLDKEKAEMKIKYNQGNQLVDRIF